MDDILGGRVDSVPSSAVWTFILELEQGFKQKSWLHDHMCFGKNNLGTVDEDLEGSEAWKCQSLQYYS